MAGMNKIAHIPGVLIHGRLDVSSPLEAAWNLHKAWPNSELIVRNEGHGGDEMIEELVRAADRFAATT
jgi:proline iminopeptidase